MKKTFINKASFIAFLLIFGIVNAKATAASLEEEKIFDKGKKHFKSERYNLALPYFLELQKRHPDNPNFNYCVGFCYYNVSSMYDSCIYYLTLSTKAVTLYYKNQYAAPKAPAKAYYYLGMAYLRNNMTETAIKHFKHYERFLDPEVKSHQQIKIDIDRQIQICEKEKMYAMQQRQLKTASRDSLYREIEFYKENYVRTAMLLEEKNNEVNRLLEDIEAMSKTQKRSIGTPVTQVIPDNNLFTVQVMVAEKEVADKNFDKIPDLKKCRTPDGLYHYITGEFPTREAADARCREIRELGFNEAWVCPVFQCK